MPKGWSICRLEDVIKYEQPTAYIVESTAYRDDYLIPVLTAGKSFVIGYTDEKEGIYNKLPCIYGRQNKKYNYAKQKVHWTEVLKSVLRKCSTEIIGANHGD